MPRLANLFDSLGVGPDDFIGAVLSPRPGNLHRAIPGEGGARRSAVRRFASPCAGGHGGSARFGSPPSRRVRRRGHAALPRVPAPRPARIPRAGRPQRARGWEGLLGGTSASPIRRPVPLAGLTTVGYTSGTTGAPKGVTMGHPAAAECARRFTEVLGAVFEDDEPRGFLTGIPVFAAGSGTIVPALLSGMTNFVPDRFDARRALDLIRGSRIAATFVTPSMLIDLLDEEDLESSADSLALLIYGSANTPVPKIEEAVRRLGPKLLRLRHVELLPGGGSLGRTTTERANRPASREVLRWSRVFRTTVWRCGSKTRREDARGGRSEGDRDLQLHLHVRLLEGPGPDRRIAAERLVALERCRLPRRARTGST